MTQTEPPRPALMTPELLERLASLIRVGNAIETAARSAGLSSETFHDWMRRGLSGAPEDEPFREFRAAVERARTESESILVTRIAKAANNGSWSAAAWVLERRFPERWAKATKQLPGERPPTSTEIEDLEQERDQATSFELLDELAHRRARMS